MTPPNQKKERNATEQEVREALSNDGGWTGLIGDSNSSPMTLQEIEQEFDEKFGSLNFRGKPQAAIKLLLRQAYEAGVEETEVKFMNSLGKMMEEWRVGTGWINDGSAGLKRFEQVLKEALTPKP